MAQTKSTSLVVDFLNLNKQKLNCAELKHLKLLLYWPIYGLLFLFVERFYQVESYFPMYCSLDDKIPFCEFFVVPYLFWFVYLVGMHIYTLLYDTEAFKKMMKFVIITYTAAIVIYFIFPTCQELRPVIFERDNIFTRFLTKFYLFDTNTNVCPSIHVIGSLAVMFTAFRCKGLNKTSIKIFFVIAAMLICVSTVFLKQHSVLDILAAIPICIVAYYICFCRKEKKAFNR